MNIPSINLWEEVYSINSEHNFVDQHVQILKDSKIEDSFFLFAGHSGSGSASYFNDLRYVELGDLVFIFMSDREFCYMVEEIYYIRKNGYFLISSEEFQNSLYLITCSLDYPLKQLVIRARLVY